VHGGQRYRSPFAGLSDVGGEPALERRRHRLLELHALGAAGFGIEARKRLHTGPLRLEELVQPIDNCHA
jgi:hypothetical protein